jgi:hypothetical protein
MYDTKEKLYALSIYMLFLGVKEERSMLQYFIGSFIDFASSFFR